MRKSDKLPGMLGLAAIVVGVLGIILGLVVVAGGYPRSGVWSCALGVVCVISGVSVRALIRRRQD